MVIWGDAGGLVEQGYRFTHSPILIQYMLFKFGLSSIAALGKTSCMHTGSTGGLCMLVEYVWGLHELLTCKNRLCLLLYVLTPGKLYQTSGNKHHQCFALEAASACACLV